MDPVGPSARPASTPTPPVTPQRDAPPAAPASAPPAQPASTGPRQVQDGFDASPSRASGEKRPQGDTFAPATAPGAQGTAPKGNPWDFRGGPDSEIGKTIQGMVDRARTSTTKIGGQSVESLLTKSIFANKDITNEQIMAMSRLKPGDVASSQKSIERTEKEIPDSRSHPNHKFTVDLLHATTGIDRETLSRNGPDLGMVGSAEKKAILPWNRWQDRPFLWKPGSDKEALSTALHDFTDTVSTAGIKGVQKSIWRSEDRETSAINSWKTGVPERFVDVPASRQGDGTVYAEILRQRQIWGPGGAR